MRLRWKKSNVLDDLSYLGLFEVGRVDLGWEPIRKRKR